MLLRLAKNFVSLLVFNVIDKIAFAFLFIVIARNVDKSAFGIYNLVITLIFIGGMVVNFGIENVLIREIAKDRSRTHVLCNNALLLTTLFASLAWPLLIYLTSMLHFDPQVAMLLKGGGLIFFFMGVSQVASAVIKAYERIEVFAAIALCQSLANLFLGIIVLKSGAGIPGLVAVMVATEAVKSAWLTLVSRRLFKREAFRLDFTILLHILKLAFPFALIMVYALVLDRVNILLMGRLKSLSEVAVYGVVSKFADFLSLFSASMIGSLYPALSARLSSDKKESWRLYNSSVGAFALFGFGIGVFVVICAQPIISLLFGQQYIVGTSALRWMGIVFLLTMLSGPVGLLLLATGDQMYRIVMICVIVLITNILLSLWLIPSLSFTGAAIATLISVAIGFAGRLILSRLYFGRLPHYVALVWRAAAASATMGGVLLLLRQLHIIVLTALGAMSYLSMLYILGEFRQSQYRPVLNKIKSIFSMRGAQP